MPLEVGRKCTVAGRTRIVTLVRAAGRKRVQSHAPDVSETLFLCYFGRGRERVAQLVEHRPFKALVLGSSPSALTIFPL